MATKKIKKTVKKSLPKAKKKVGVLRRKKNKIGNPNPDSIFDSRIGKTNALFVSEPEEKNVVNQNVQSVLPATDNQPQKPEEVNKIFSWFKSLFFK